MKTQLGVKWSAMSDEVADLVDIQEVAGWDLDRCELCGPLLLHNLDSDFSIAVPEVLDGAWLERCRWALERTQAPWFSLHLGFSAEAVRFDGHMLPSSPVLGRDVCFERMANAVGFAVQHLDLPVLIENLDYCPEGAYEHICEPRFISKIVESTGCRMLLDLAHLQVSADWLGYSADEYASLLPLDHVIEVHLSSPRMLDKHLDDGHFELLEQDFRLLSWVLERCTPRAVVLEYTRDRRSLERQLRQIRSILDHNGIRVGELRREDKSDRPG